MKDLKYFKDKCERLERVITMRECQLRCACDGLEYITCVDGIADAQYQAHKSLDAVDAIYELHKGEKIADGFLEPKKRG